MLKKLCFLDGNRVFIFINNHRESNVHSIEHYNSPGNNRLRFFSWNNIEQALNVIEELGIGCVSGIRSFGHSTCVHFMG